MCSSDLSGACHSIDPVAVAGYDPCLRWSAVWKMLLTPFIFRGIVDPLVVIRIRPEFYFFK